MVLLPTVDRNKRQDSPMLWLSLLAGSLALHLVLLLIGRWYFSQPQGSPTSNATQIEIAIAPSDSNATPTERSSTVERPNTANTSPRSVTPPTAPTETPPNAIVNTPTAPAAPDRPAPTKPTRRDDRTASPNNGQQPLNQTPTDRGGPSSPTSPASGGNNTPGRNPAPGTVDPNKPQTPGTADPTKPQTPGTADPTKPQTPVGGGTQLPNPTQPGQGGQFGLRGQLGQISIPRGFSDQRNADRISIRTLKVPEGTITLTPADTGGENVLKLRVRFVINNKDGTFNDGSLEEKYRLKVLDDSPIFDKHPNLDREILASIAASVLQNAEFDVNVLPGAAQNSLSDWEAPLTITLAPEK